MTTPPDESSLNRIQLRALAFSGVCHAAATVSAIANGRLSDPPDFLIGAIFTQELADIGDVFQPLENFRPAMGTAADLLSASFARLNRRVTSRNCSSWRRSCDATAPWWKSCVTCSMPQQRTARQIGSASRLTSIATPSANSASESRSPDHRTYCNTRPAPNAYVAACSPEYGLRGCGSSWVESSGTCSSSADPC